MVGATLPAVGLTIKAGELRGVASNGMICSLTELGLTDQSDGIAILDELQESLPPTGSPVAPLLGLDDTVLELAITANRPDGLSMVGIAREVAALTGGSLSLPELDLNPSITPLNTELDGCFYSITRIEGVDGSKPSPNWLQQRLERGGVNSVNAVVDVTNLVMLEQGQPLHAFDADVLEQLAGQPVDAKSFAVRPARDGEMFVGLDDQKRSLDSRVQVVTCHDRPVAVAGVMGSLESGVTAKTQNIWLESALFAPPRVRQSARALGLRTDASSRFEKGLPIEMTLPCSARASTLLSQEFSCSDKGRWVGGTSPAAAEPVLLRRSALHQLLGPLDAADGPENLDDTSIENCLSALGCQL
jgi:phenylalanyl-tRNA synthetase beta chain